MLIKLLTSLTNINKDSIYIATAIKNSLIYQNNSFLEKIISTDTAIGLIIEILGGLIFLYVLYWFFTPSIKIADKIAKVSIENSDGFHYHFKIINNSYFFSLTNIKMEVFEAKPISNSQDIQLISIELSKKYFPFLDSIREGKSKNNSFALKLRTSDMNTNAENIEEFFTNNPSSYVIAVFKCTHKFSLLSKTFEQKFYRNSIKLGEFNQGKDLGIS